LFLYIYLIFFNAYMPFIPGISLSIITNLNTLFYFLIFKLTLLTAYYPLLQISKFILIFFQSIYITLIIC